MKLAIMQPYAFPYLGYFQLINAVDLFVLYDDVEFIRRGWVNRNFLSSRSGPQRFTLPVQKQSRGHPISAMQLVDKDVHQKRLLKTIELLYRRAPHYEQARPVLERAIDCPEEGLADYIHHSLVVLAEYLGVTTPLVRSSQSRLHSAAKRQERVVAICRAKGANMYVNAEGGMELYDEAEFRQHEIDLRFLIHRPRPYMQNAKEFLPRLSIIDVMMFNSCEEIALLLKDYRLVRAGEV